MPGLLVAVQSRNLHVPQSTQRAAPFALTNGSNRLTHIRIKYCTNWCLDEDVCYTIVVLVHTHEVTALFIALASRTLAAALALGVSLPMTSAATSRALRLHLD